MMKKIVYYIHHNSLFRFLLVGGLGTFINLGVFFICADILQINASVSAIIAFCVAVTQNYILNHIWSFKKYVDESLNFKRYYRFIIINIVGLTVNLVILNFILFYFNPSLKVVAQCFGIISGTFFNYLGSKFFVFKNLNLE